LEVLRAVARSERPARFYGFEPPIDFDRLFGPGFFMESFWKALTVDERDAVMNYISPGSADLVRRRLAANKHPGVPKNKTSPVIVMLR
jgi:hypothetical protein